MWRTIEDCFLLSMAMTTYRNTYGVLSRVRPTCQADQRRGDQRQSFFTRTAAGGEALRSCEPPGGDRSEIELRPQARVSCVHDGLRLEPIRAVRPRARRGRRHQLAHRTRPAARPRHTQGVWRELLTARRPHLRLTSPHQRPPHDSATPVGRRSHLFAITLDTTRRHRARAATIDSVESPAKRRRWL